MFHREALVEDAAERFARDIFCLYSLSRDVVGEFVDSLMYHDDRKDTRVTPFLHEEEDAFPLFDKEEVVPVIRSIIEEHIGDKDPRTLSNLLFQLTPELNDIRAKYGKRAFKRLQSIIRRQRKELQTIAEKIGKANLQEIGDLQALTMKHRKRQRTEDGSESD